MSLAQMQLADFLFPDEQTRWSHVVREGRRVSMMVYKCYGADRLKAAIHDVHMGSCVSVAAQRHGVPRRTLGYHISHCKESHEGKCCGAYLLLPQSDSISKKLN